MNKSNKIAAQGGFTLIELIVVIVILGILAATALPKFADMGSDARKATVQGAKGSIESVSAMVHGKALINPAATSAKLEDVTIAIKNGYPSVTDADPDLGAYLQAAAGLKEWTKVPSGTAATHATFPETSATEVAFVPATLASSENAKECYVKYTEATTTAPAKVSVDTDKC